MRDLFMYIYIYIIIQQEKTIQVMEMIKFVKMCHTSIEKMSECSLCLTIVYTVDNK